MARPKVIVQLYPMLPARDRAERERLRPLGRDSELYHRVLHESLDLVREIDQMGVWGISTIEHHLHSEGYELGPNPGVLNAWWAGAVKRAYLGALGYVMATRDPIRVAEETAILDHMTNGRFFVGLTRGYQARWTNILGQSIEAVATLSDGSSDDARNRQVFEERTEMLLKCWAEDSVAIDAPHYQIPYPFETGVRGYPAWKNASTAGAPGEVGPDGSIRRVSVVPKLYTKPHPPIFVAMSGSASSIPFLARHGFRPTYFTNLENVLNFARMYVDEARAAGKSFTLGQRQNIVRWFHVGRNEQEFRDKLMKYDFEMYDNFYTAFFPKLPHFADANATLQSMIDSGIFMGGTVEQLKQQWRHIFQNLPAEYITLIWHYAQVPKEEVLEELDVFMTKVLPELDAPDSVEERAVEAHPA
ncbi:MAG TPA: LLM class flavin-dependent oxidoreductase [Candidatus Binataceae bacterium]|nr:LLM class flavin-dependent oxidoreductase [Candidatus Binataceae bacterium]